MQSCLDHLEQLNGGAAEDGPLQLLAPLTADELGFGIVEDDLCKRQCLPQVTDVQSCLRTLVRCRAFLSAGSAQLHKNVYDTLSTCPAARKM